MARKEIGEQNVVNDKMVAGVELMDAFQGPTGACEMT